MSATNSSNNKPSISTMTSRSRSRSRSPSRSPSHSPSHSPSQKEDVVSDDGGMKNPNNNTRTRTRNRNRTRTRTLRTTAAVMRNKILMFLAFSAIALSVLTIYSCNFFSYTDIGATTDGFTAALNSNNNSNNNNFDENNEEILVEEYMYSPFEYLNEAGVGLFAYYMGNPTSSSASTGGTFYKHDPMCFLYCDELNDFKWFFNNYNIEEESLLSRPRIDLWIISRYCSIFAPCVAILGTIQLIIFNWFYCGGSKCYSNNNTLLIFMTFFVASLLQFGTFTIMFSSPQLSSFNLNGEVIQNQFCFSSSSNIKCRIDSGAWLSLGAAIGYLIISFSTLYCSSTTDNDTDTNDNNSRCCGGCCIHRGNDDESTTNVVERNNNRSSASRKSRNSSGPNSTDSSLSSCEEHNDGGRRRKVDHSDDDDDDRHNEHVTDNDDDDDDARRGIDMSTTSDLIIDSGGDSGGGGYCASSDPKEIEMPFSSYGNGNGNNNNNNNNCNGK